MHRSALWFSKHLNHHPRVHPSLFPGMLVVFALLLGVTFGCSKKNDATGPEPTLGTADPDSGTVGTLVTLSGSNFQDGLHIYFGDYPAPDYTLVSSNTVTVFAPDSLVGGQSYTISVTNPGGSGDELVDQFRAVAPDLQVVNGVSKPSGQLGSTVILEGKAFGDLVGKGSVFFTTGTGTPVEAPVTLEDNWTNEFIVTTVPASAVTGPVWIQTMTGVSDSITFRIDSAATFSPSQIFWTETLALPDSSQGHRAAFVSNDDRAGIDNEIYVTGGADGALVPRSNVWRGTVDATGNISTWSPMASLPDARAFHGMALATPFNALIDTTVAGHLYVIGGIDSSGAPTATVFRAAVQADRSLGGWTAEQTLPVPLHSMGVSVFRSWLYISGGAAAGDSAVSETYRARINMDGTLGMWEAQASLPAPRAYGALAQFGAVLYMVGGDAGSVAPGSAAVSATQSANIYYNRLTLRTGELLTGWTLNPSTLIKPVAKHSALVAGGTMLVSGGIYNGSANSATEHQYATINLDGSIGSFGGATGSQTIANAGGDPFFNHGAVTYVDGTGNAHVIILGGNNVKDPASPTNRNWYY